VAEHLGSDTFFHIHNTGLTDMITVRAIGDVNLKHGDTIQLNPRINELHRFDAQGLRID
jgi:multiple sugar transport system ATP-binding protein